MHVGVDATIPAINARPFVIYVSVPCRKHRYTDSAPQHYLGRLVAEIDVLYRVSTDADFAIVPPFGTTVECRVV